MITKTIQIGDRVIGAGHPAYLIAELSANHNHDFDQAARLIHEAKAAGADAVKLQTYTPDTMTVNCRRPEFMIGKGTIWEGKNLYDLYGEAYTPWDWQPRLKAIADDIGIHLFSTPFDPTAVDFLETMNVPAHKIASFELIDLPLIEKIASTGKPLIISTGMASLGEISEAVATVRGVGATDFALLHCVSAYPAPADQMNLKTIPHLAEAFGVPAGLSDHTLGVAAAVTAVALGACIIEKHFTLSRSVPGPDSAFSLEPAEFRALVDAVRVAEQALGQVRYEMNSAEDACRVFRRSLFIVNDVKAGELLTTENVRSIRPGHGLPPKFLSRVLGRRAARDLTLGTPLDWDCLSS